MNLVIDRNDHADLNVRAALAQLDRDNRAFWLAIPEDVMAGIYEEIVELEQEGTAQQHWAWPYINWTKQMALPLH